MGNSVSAFIVILEEDVHPDAVKKTLDALRMVKNVLSVKPLERSWESQMAEERARSELGQKLFQVIHPEWGKKEK